MAYSSVNKNWNDDKDKVLFSLSLFMLHDVNDRMRKIREKNSQRLLLTVIL